MSSVEIESITIFPLAVCSSITNNTVPPLEPDLPQESFWALKKFPVVSLFIIVLFFKFIVAVVFVI